MLALRRGDRVAHGPTTRFADVHRDRNSVLYKRLLPWFVGAIALGVWFFVHQQYSNDRASIGSANGGVSKAATHIHAPETPASACALQYVKGRVIVGYCSGALIASDKFLSSQTCARESPPRAIIRVACGSEPPVGIKKGAVPIGYNYMMRPDFVNKVAMLNTVQNMVVYTLLNPLKVQPAVIELDPDSFTTYTDCIVAGVGATAKAGVAEAFFLNDFGKYSKENLFIVSEPIVQPGDGGAPVYCRDHENVLVLRAIYVAETKYGNYYARLDANQAFLREVLAN
jgi:hypothetical protein